MSIVNYVIAPAIATLATNQSCFYFVFNLHSPVTSSSTISVCDVFYVDITNPTQTVCASSVATTFTTSFYPQFQYSYACGSALLVTYIPVLMYTYIAAGFIAPIGRYFLAMNPSYLKPLSIVHDIFFVESRTTETIFQRENEIRNGIIRVRGRGVVVTLLLHSTVLLTFGIACPILGIAVAVTILNDTVIWKLLVGRYLIMIAFIRQIIQVHASKRPTQYAMDNTTITDLEIMERDNQDAWRGLFSCFVLAIWVVVIFWSLLFFDMIGDIYTDNEAMATTLCYGLSIPVMILLYKYAMMGSWSSFNFMSTVTEKYLDEIGLDRVLEKGVVPKERITETKIEAINQIIRNSRDAEDGGSIGQSNIEKSRAIVNPMQQQDVSIANGEKTTQIEMRTSLTPTENSNERQSQS